MTSGGLKHIVSSEVEMRWSGEYSPNEVQVLIAMEPMTEITSSGVSGQIKL